MKNPIAVALGNALREIRNNNNIPFDELMENIGINSSYYRLLESGTHTIHISKTIDVVKSFNDFGATISYDGLAKLVMGVYFTQPLIKLATDMDKNFEVEKNKLFSSLESYDKKLFVLFNHFDKFNLFKSVELNNKEVIELLEKEKITDLVLEFLNNYSEFGESNLHIQKTSLVNKLNKLPTIYFEFIQDSIDNLFYLPTVMGNITLWEWEQKNKQYFTEMICLTRNPKSVVSQENLSRYKYNYLWEHNFKSVKMILIDDNNSDIEFKNEFCHLLRKNLDSYVDKEKINSFQKAMDKISFSVIRENYRSDIINELLKGRALIAKVGRSNVESYDAIWIFTIKKDKDVMWNVAFLADINYEEGDNKFMLKNVISLSYKELKEKAKVLHDIWIESNNVIDEI